MIAGALTPAWRALLALLLAAMALLAAGCANQPTAGSAAQGSDANAPLPESAEESDTRRRARIRLELGAGYYQQGNIPVALDELRQALQIDPNYAAVYGVLGLIYMDLNERDRAEDAFQRGLQLRPNDSDLNNGYGWFLCNTGREKRSIEFFQRALADPLYATPAKPLHNAGICSLKIGEEALAEAYFLRSFQIDPLNAVAMYNLGELFLKRRDAERARFYAQRLISTYDPTAQTLWLALRVERTLGNRDAEVSLAAQLRRRFPESREANLLASGRFSD